MLKKAMVAAAVIGMSVAAAPQALAIGDDSGPNVANGNGASSAFGNSSTEGDMSPQLALVPIQGVPVLSDQLNQQCADNSTQTKRDAALSHILEDLSVLSANSED